MNVLLVSYSAPPRTSPRAIRVARVGRALLEAGDRVQVLAADEGGNDAWLLGLLEGADFVRVRGPLEARTRRPAPSAGAPRGPASTTRTPGLRRHLENLAIPDRRAEFIPLALDPRLPLERPDIIVSFYPKFSGVLAAHRLAGRFGCPHVVDYGDPFSNRHGYSLHPLRRRVDAALEARVLRRARGVVLSAEPQRPHLRSSFRRVPEIRVITNGYDARDYAPAPSETDGALRYLGNLYSPRLDFASLGDALGPDTWESLDIVGKREAGVLDQLPEWVRTHSPVDFQTSLRLMQSADALFLMGNRAGLQIPSKVFNYLGARRPVLCMTERERDPMRDLGLGDQVVFCLPEEPDVRRALHQVHERIDQDFEPNPTFSWQMLGRTYREALAAWA